MPFLSEVIENVDSVFMHLSRVVLCVILTTSNIMEMCSKFYIFHVIKLVFTKFQISIPPTFVF